MNTQEGSNLTLRDVVQALQELVGSDDEAVAVLAHLIRTRRVQRPAATSR